jgi:hypothetical protein
VFANYHRYVTAIGLTLLLMAVAIPATAQAACPNMPPPKIERVNFTNSENIIIDHRNDTTHAEVKKLRTEGKELEHPLEIGEYKGTENESDGIQWKAKGGGKVTKNWPLAFPQATTARITNTRIALEAAAANLLKTKLESGVTLVGNAKFGGTAFTFTQTLTKAEVEKQATEHPTYLQFSAEDAASAALPKKLEKAVMNIKWEWSVTVEGTAFNQAIGETYHLTYLTRAKALGKIYLTMLAVATQGMERTGGGTAESEVIAGVWAGFTKLNFGLEEKQCKTVECPTVYARNYNPEKAEKGEIDELGSALWYYEELASGETLKEYEEKGYRGAECVGAYTTVRLLEALDGECGGWQEAFVSALEAEGISSTKVKIFAQYGNAAECETKEACLMLVSSWKLAEPGMSGEAKFPVAESEVLDEVGASGQSVQNPQSLFNNHRLVEIENNLYDPSYGVGPIGNGKPGERANNVHKYKEKYISGFCKKIGAVLDCVKSGAGNLGSE